MSTKTSGLDKTYKILIILSIVLLGLIYGRSILIPIVFAFFFSLALYPIVQFFTKYLKSRVFSIILSLLIVISVIGGGIYLLSAQINSLIQELPSLQEKFLSVINSVGDKIENNFHYTSKEQIAYLKQGATNILKQSGSFIGGAVTTTSSVFSFLSLVPIYVFFILLYQDNFKLFFIKLRNNKENVNYLNTVSKIKDVVQGYISGMGIVILIIAVLNCIGLFALGIKYALFFGIFSALLTIIPYIGIAIGASLPIIFALITKDSIWYPIGVMMIYAVIQFLEGNLITPNIVGNKVNINPLAAVFALILGGSIWGIIGMILAIPITGIIQILLYQSDHTQAYAVLLRAENEESPDQKEVEDED